MATKAGKLAVPLQSALDRADESVVEPPRGYVGASVIAGECERALWYSFRWATDIQFSGRLLQRFETGHAYELRIIERLQAAGFEVHYQNPRARNRKGQYRGELYGGLLAGHIDGFVAGSTPELELDSWHLLEIKAMASAKYAYADDTYEEPVANKHPTKHPTKAGNESKIEGRWWKCKRTGVKRAHQEHYGQMQAYMGLSHELQPSGKPFHTAWGLGAPLQRALYVAVNTDTEQIHAELVEFEPIWWHHIKRRALRIFRATEPLKRVKESPQWPPCSFCDHLHVCHHGHPLQTNCRTCKHAELRLPGDQHTYGTRAQWLCTHHKAGCGDFTACDSHTPITEPMSF